MSNKTHGFIAKNKTTFFLYYIFFLKIHILVTIYSTVTTQKYITWLNLKISISSHLVKVKHTMILASDNNDLTQANTLVACPNRPTMSYYVHLLKYQDKKLMVQKYCCYVPKRCKRHYLVKKWNDFIKNYHKFFNLKVTVIMQVGGCIWAGNQ